MMVVLAFSFVVSLSCWRFRSGPAQWSKATALYAPRAVSNLRISLFGIKCRTSKTSESNLVISFSSGLNTKSLAALASIFARKHSKKLLKRRRFEADSSPSVSEPKANKTREKPYEDCLKHWWWLPAVFLICLAIGYWCPLGLTRKK